MGFKVAGYSINANSSGTHTEEAVWYDVVITDQGKQHKATFYGGSSATWIYDGTNILFVTGKTEPSAKAFSTEHGQLSLPLNNPTVQKVIAFVKALDHKPAEEKA
jgi:hypothetical protein